jgi:hypothetical protein
MSHDVTVRREDGDDVVAEFRGRSRAIATDQSL